MAYIKTELPVHAILLQYDDETGAGSVTCDPSLYQICPKCGLRSCVYQCDESHLGQVQSEDEVASRVEYNGVIDGILSLILAQACVGINIKSPTYLKSLKITFDAIVSGCVTYRHANE